MSDEILALQLADPAKGTPPMTRTTPADRIRALPDYEDRLEAARARAAWELGESSWADVILDAFLDPEASREALAEEMRQP
jgi:hypothetical protein